MSREPIFLFFREISVEVVVLKVQFFGVQISMMRLFHYFPYHKANEKFPEQQNKLTFIFKPQTFKAINDANRETYEQQKILNLFDDYYRGSHVYTFKKNKTSKKIFDGFQ